MKNKGLEKTLTICGFIFILISIFWFLNVFRASRTESDYTRNFQQEIYISEQKVVNTRAYIKENKLISEFIVEPKSAETKSQEQIEEELFDTRNDITNRLMTAEYPDIETPIYYQTGVSDKDIATLSSGTQSTEYQENNIDILSEGYIKQGQNELFDVSELTKNKVYYVAIFPQGTDKKSVDSNTKPEMVITYDAKKVPEFLDMSGFENSFQMIKNDPELNQKYSKWIYFNELNPNIITTFLGEEILNFRPEYKQYSSKSNAKNCLDYIENIMISDTKMIQNLKENGAIVGLGEYVVNLNYQYKEHYNMTKIKSYYEQMLSLQEQYDKASSLYIGNLQPYAKAKIPELYEQYKTRINELNDYEKVAFLKSIIAKFENYSDGQNCVNSSPYCSAKPDEKPKNDSE